MGILDERIARLNPKQRAAVLAPDGAILVVAGAGSGKTSVLTTRMAHQLLSGARPDDMLAVTFTNKAAREMRDRLGTLVGEGPASRLWMGSFHGISLKILRQYPEAAGLRNASFRIMDDDEQRVVIKKAAEELGLLGDLDGKELKQALLDYHAGVMAWKEEGYMPDDVAAIAELVANEDGRELLALYRRYAQMMLDKNACDFADLLLHPVNLFRTRPEIHRAWSHRFQHILVDEFQDTNQLQYSWLRLLAGNGRLFCVGDIDQSIYEWRGARPAIMQHFPEDFAGAQVITIDQNYRSSQNILDVANKIVAMNPRMGDKVLNSGVTGAPVEVFGFPDEHAEADTLAVWVQGTLKRGIPASEVAILMRSAGQMRRIEQALRVQSIPYEVVGGQRFDERLEVKDALAYLRLSLDPTDDEAFLRVANRPLRGIGKTTAEKIVTSRLREGGTIAEALDRVASDPRQRLTAAVRQVLPQMASLIRAAHLQSEAKMLPGAILLEILRTTQYLAWIKAEDPEKANVRADVLEDMVAEGHSGRFSTIGDWLQDIALLSAVDATEGLAKVRLSTIHAAKGLEFDVVFTPCLEDGILPNKRAVEESYGLAEERRITHVAWTRPRKRLCISFSQSRYGQEQAPSQFLEEADLTPVLVASPNSYRSQRPRFAGKSWG